MHPSLLAVGLIASVLHCLIRALGWYRVSDVHAVGIYSVLFKDLPDPNDPACVRLAHREARSFERELRSHTGSVAKLFSPLYYHLRWLTLAAALLCIWISNATRWLMLMPFVASVASWAYFHLCGWRCLQAGCVRYRRRKLNETPA